MDCKIDALICHLLSKDFFLFVFMDYIRSTKQNCFSLCIEPQSEEEKAKKEAGKPQVDEIVPVYRRDCHEEVYAGSHQYPGRGIYLLKFDNSYSLWRSKSVYYRVYYTR